MKERFKRQSFLGRDSDKVLGALCAGVVGLGGGGSHIVQQLAHIGVGRYVLADPDRIEDTNLNRLVGGTAADVKAGRLKTTIAARQIKRVLPSADVITIKRHWQLDAAQLRHCDVIFGCVDSFDERRQLEEAARRFLIPYIDIGMDVLRTSGGSAIVGQVALSMPGKPCMRCMGIIRESVLAEEAEAYGAAGGKPQVVWPNGILASVAVGLAVGLVCPWHTIEAVGLLFEYDGNSTRVQRSSVLDYLPTSCEHFSGVNQLGDPWFSLPSHVASTRHGRA